MKKYFFYFLCLIIVSCKKEDSTEALIHTTGTIVDNTVINNLVDLPSGSSGLLPTSKDLSQFMPPIRMQGGQGSCVSFALAYLKSYHEKLEKGYSYTDNSKIMSPAFIYNQVKANNDCLKGSSTITSLNFLMNSGISTEQEFPYDEYSCSKQPNSQLKNSSIKNNIKEWKGFDFKTKSNSTILYEMKYYINEMQPIIIDVQVDYNFDKLGRNTTEEKTWKFNISQSAGYHTMIIVGYDDSKEAFKVWNSWDTDWGNDGWIWIDYNMLFRNVRYAFVTWDNFSQNGGGIDCNGLNWSGGPFSGSNCPNYVIFQHIQGGTPPYKYYIENILVKTSSETYFEHCISSKGTYNLKCIDSKGCEINTTKIIN